MDVPSDFSALSAKLACPYDPDVPLFPDGPTQSARCAACGRAFGLRDGVLDLRPDALRDGTASWTPGPQDDWNPGALGAILRGARAKSNDAVASGLETLDIGCGARASGTVNIDVYVPDPLPPNFVLAAADQLPFLAKTFDRVVSRYVIEHVTEPAQFITACLRLARQEVDVLTDNGDWIGELAFRLIGRGRIFHPEHVYKWSAEYLRNLCARFDVESVVTLETLSETYAVRLCGFAARGRVLAPLLHRDLRARLIPRRLVENCELGAPGQSASVVTPS